MKNPGVTFIQKPQYNYVTYIEGKDHLVQVGQDKLRYLG